MNQEKQSLRIAFLAPYDPRDKAAFSTVLYYMGQALEKHCEIYYYEPIVSFEKRFGRLIDAVSRRLFKKMVAYDHLLPVAKKHGKLAAQGLEGRSFDAIVAVMNPLDIALLETDIPIVLVLDVTFALRQDYDPRYSNLWRWSAKQANRVEEMAYQNSEALLYCTHWAAHSAIEDYGVDPHKVHTIYFGANLDTIPSREMVLAKRKSECCRLLLIGLGWERKGGTIAFETLLELEKLGIRAELIVCGCTPPKGVAHERMRVIPFLDKNDERQSKQLEKLYAMSDFLLVPTRCEAYGHVFCEASAFGLPSITTNTGGVPEAVRNGENGYVLPYSARGSAYAQIIAEIYRDDQRYTALVESSRDAFESRMNWDVWSTNVMQVLQNVTARTPLTSVKELSRG